LNLDRGVTQKTFCRRRYLLSKKVTIGEESGESCKEQCTVQHMDTHTVGILGVGMMGGSIALAALRAGYRVCLHDLSGANKLADERFRNALIVDDLRDLAAQSRIIFLATPISAIPLVVARLAPFLGPEHIVSDVASVKGPIVKVIRRAIDNKSDYIPVHPMAGSEKSGAGAARADLFDGTVTLLCSEFSGDLMNIQLITSFWKELGSRVFNTNSGRHDEMVAAMSHLPHLIAALLVTQVADTDSEALSLCGSGFRDLTRIASGAPELWTDILLSNSESLSRHLSAFRDLIDRTLPLLVRNDGKNLQALLDAAKLNRDRISR
jgi:prephenate dehydrogenase